MVTAVRHSRVRLAAALAALAVMTAGAAVAGPVKGQIVVDPDNPRWFKYHKGGPFFMAGPGDPEDFLYRGRLRADGTRDGDQMKLIKKLARSGANSIYLMAVRSHGGDGESTHNPFVDHDPDKGLNQTVLDQWETWFDAMDRAGIVIFFIFYDDDARVWRTGHEVGQEERQFVRDLVNRFEHHKHLIWVVAEEYQEALSKRSVAEIAAEIRKADDYEHPIAVHKWHGLGFDEFADDPNIDQFAIQLNVPTARDLHEGQLIAWHEADGRYNLNLAEAKNWGTGKQARRKSWAVAMAGGYVMVFQMDIATTAARDLRDNGVLRRFMESTDFHRLEPRDDLAAGDTKYVMARPGESYIAYAVDAERGLGLRDLGAGTYRMHWLDIPSGREVFEDGVELTGGRELLPLPDGFGGEVAVHLTRVEGRIADRGDASQPAPPSAPDTPDAPADSDRASGPLLSQPGVRIVVVGLGG